MVELGFSRNSNFIFPAGGGGGAAAIGGHATYMSCVWYGYHIRGVNLLGLYIKNMVRQIKYKRVKYKLYNLKTLEMGSLGISY